MKSTCRRNFLLAAGLASGAAVAAIATKVPPRALRAPHDVRPRTGYRASAHILKYYKTTQV